MTQKPLSEPGRYGAAPADRSRSDAAARRTQLLDLLRIERVCSVRWLADQLKVHPLTVRNDVAHLKASGLVEHVRGSVQLSSSSEPPGGSWSPDAPLPGRPPASVRADLILRVLAGQDRISIAQLAATLAVHEITVRRDLEVLSRLNLVEREGGMIVRPPRPPALTFEQRTRLQQGAKAAMARAAMRWVEPGMRLALDASTSCLAVAPHLAGWSGEVMTPGMDVATALLRLGVRVTLLGGAVDPHSRSTAVEGKVGPVDLALFSCAGVSATAGFTDARACDARGKARLLAAAGIRVALLDASKLGLTASAAVLPLQGAALISDRPWSADDLLPHGQSQQRADELRHGV